MIPEYALELLHIRISETIESLCYILANIKISQQNKWRYDALLRELGSFRYVIWGDKIPKIKKEQQ